MEVADRFYPYRTLLVATLKRGKLQSIVAGIGDAGLASLATFVTSLYAVRSLEPDLLGAYSVLFTAFIVANILPGMLYFQPARVVALKLEPAWRVTILPGSIAVGVLLGLLAGAVTPLAGIVALGELSVTELAPLAITAGLLTCVSAVQDHIRGTLHLSELSSHAARVSAVQLASVCVALLLLHVSVGSSWVPFGSLVIANCVSLSFGLWWVRKRLFIKRLELPKTRLLMKEGWPIFLVAVVPYLTRLLAAGLVASFFALDAVGFYEASRVVASPIYVIALGIAQALSPSLMQAGYLAKRAISRRPRLIFMLAFGPISLCYALIAGWEFALNPMQELVPLAYEKQGLVLIALASVVIPNLALPFRAEVVGARRSSDLVAWVFFSSAVHLAVVAATVGQLGAFAIPAGIICGGLVETATAWRAANRLYDDATEAEPAVAAPSDGFLSPQTGRSNDAFMPPPRPLRLPQSDRTVR